MNDNKEIKIVDAENTDFVWLIVTDKARAVFKTELFTLYAINNDNSESQVESMEELEEYLKRGQEIAIEVGHIPKVMTPERKRIDNASHYLRKQILKSYNLVWKVNGVTKETLITNKSYGICFYEMNKRKGSTHKTGILEIIENK